MREVLSSMKKLSLFGTSLEALSEVVSAQSRINCFYEVREDEDKAKIIIRSTPGLTQFSSVPYAIRGWLVVNNYLYVVAGANVYKIDTLGVVTTLGTMLPSTSTVVGMSNNATQIIIVNGTNGYILTIATGVLAQITSANFPNGSTSVIYIDGYFVINVAGTSQFYKSSLYDGTTWAALDFASAENNPDILVAIDNLSGTLILWGTASIEFWQDTGGYPFPFSRLTGSTAQWGLAAQWSRAYVANTMMFLGSNTQGAVQVLMLNGYTPQRVSNADIEHQIAEFSTVSDAVALSYIIDGHIMYQITFPTANKSFLFDFNNNMWSVVQTGLTAARHKGNLGIAFNNHNYVSDYLNGNIYLLDQYNYTDNGASILREVDTRHIEMGGDVFSIDELFLDMDTGRGLQSGQGSNPQLMVQVSKDGGRTFGNERLASIGKVGQYIGPRAHLNRFGSATDFVFKIRMTDPVPFIITYGSAIIREGQQK